MSGESILVRRRVPVWKNKDKNQWAKKKMMITDIKDCTYLNIDDSETTQQKEGLKNTIIVPFSVQLKILVWTVALTK